MARRVAVGASVYNDVDDLLIAQPPDQILGTAQNLNASQVGVKVLGVASPSTRPSSIASFITDLVCNGESPTIDLGPGQGVLGWVQWAHSVGRRAHFAPVYSDGQQGGIEKWRNPNNANHAKFVAVLQELDVLDVQAQLILQTVDPSIGLNLTEGETVVLINDIQQWVWSINPNCEIHVQLWFYSPQSKLRQNPEMMIGLFNRLPNVPVVIIGGGDNSTGEQWTRDVIEGLLGRTEEEIQVFKLEVKDANLVLPTVEYADLESAKTAWEGYSAAKYTITEHPDPVSHNFTDVEVTTG